MILTIIGLLVLAAVAYVVIRNRKNMNTQEINEMGDDAYAPVETEIVRDAVDTVPGEWKFEIKEGGLQILEPVRDLVESEAPALVESEKVVEPVLGVSVPVEDAQKILAVLPEVKIFEESVIDKPVAIVQTPKKKKNKNKTNKPMNKNAKAPVKKSAKKAPKK